MGFRSKYYSGNNNNSFFFLLDRKLISMYVSHVALQTALLRERFSAQLASELGSHAALVLQMAEQVPFVLVALHALGAHVSVEFYKRK